MGIVCWQTILMKYHAYFFSKICKDVAKLVVCCSCDWRFKVLRVNTLPARQDFCCLLSRLLTFYGGL